MLEKIAIVLVFGGLGCAGIGFLLMIMDSVL